MRNETQLLCDVLGLESLVDAITSDLLAASSQSRSSSKSDGMAPTPSAILGPFYRAGAPVLPTGSSIVQAVSANVPWYAAAQAKLARFTGHVYSCAPGSPTPMPLAGAVVDVWLSAPNGLYEQQDASQPGMNLRGQFATDARGAYAFYAMRPTAYPIPDDGPAGRLLGLLDRSPWRPAHVHFIVSAPGHRTLTTQVFDAECEYVAGDSVFAVKRELVVEFRPLHGDEKAKCESLVSSALMSFRGVGWWGLGNPPCPIEIQPLYGNAEQSHMLTMKTLGYLDYDFVLSHEEANGASS